MYKLIILRIAIIMFFTSLISCKSNYTRIGEENANYIPYYLKVYKADSLFIAGKYSDSYKILDSLFKKYEPVQMRNYYEFTSFFKLKIILNKNIKIKEFSKLVSKYNLTETDIKSDSLFNTYYEKEKKYFQSNYTNLRNEFNSKLNLNLRNEIKQMVIEDQSFRKKGSRNEQMQEKIDSINSKKMIEIFSKYGYPNAYLIGNSRIDGTLVEVGILLLHTNNKERLEYFMPTVLSYIKKGQAPPIEYAFMHDQYLLYRNEKQYYGSYTMPFEKIGATLKDLNIRRSSIGLPNYGYEDWRFKTLYPKDFEIQQQYLKNLK